jgi:protein-S-isoprenylcysteine O-methyltransferase Ste14
MMIQMIAFVLLAVFYITHIGKKMRMKRKNIHIDLLADKANTGKTAAVQMALKTVTYITMTVQFLSVVFAKYVWSLPVFPTMQEDGVILMAIGAAFFITAMTTMSTNWRAGYKKGQGKTL